MRRNRCLLFLNHLRLPYSILKSFALLLAFHTGRHSFATLTLAATNDIATVSRLLGHTSVATTQIYAEVLMEDKIAAVNKLNGIF